MRQSTKLVISILFTLPTIAFASTPEEITSCDKLVIAAAEAIDKVNNNGNLISKFAYTITEKQFVDGAEDILQIGKFMIESTDGGRGYYVETELPKPEVGGPACQVTRINLMGP
ncbi:MAG: hypothetical protein ABL927_08495 [Bdellovibrionales bacterium]